MTLDDDDDSEPKVEEEKQSPPATSRRSQKLRPDNETCLREVMFPLESLFRFFIHIPVRNSCMELCTILLLLFLLFIKYCYFKKIG